MPNNSQERKIHIVLTGGHAGATAYALVNEIRKRNKPWDLSWLGYSQAFEGRKKINTFEFEVLPGTGVKTYSLYGGKFQRKLSFQTLPSLLKIPFSFLQAFLLLRKLKPDLVLSFGGFAAFPVVVSGWVLKIPVIIHEQTAAAGRANLYSANFASKIALSRLESSIYFPKDKCVLTGNPVSAQIFKVKPKDKPGNPLTILVSGGSRGSEVINQTVTQILEQLLAEYRVIHQTGVLSYSQFTKLKDSLPSKLQTHYQVYGFIHPDQWLKLMEDVDIVISRSGANMVSELLVCKRPAILIPLPIANLDEQKKNAEYAKRYGIAQILPQEELTPQRLLEEVKTLIKSWPEIAGKTRNKISPDRDATEKLITLIEEEL